MVGLVGYAPTTFRMSSEHSTIELKAHGQWSMVLEYLIMKQYQIFKISRSSMRMNAFCFTINLLPLLLNLALFYYPTTTLF